MNPVLPLPFLIPALVALVAAIAWLSWFATASLAKKHRVLFLSLRIAATAAIAALLLNPGKWILPADETETPWIILLDRSTSMTQPAGNQSRAEISKTLAEKTITTASKKEIPIRVHPFSSNIANPIENTSKLAAPDGAATDLHSSLKQLLSDAAASGSSIAGIIVLSDGRQTTYPSEADLSALSLRLRSRSIPLHTVAIGADVPTRDLVIRPARPTITVFKGQTTRIPFAVSSTGLPPHKPTIRLINDSGTVLAETSIEIPSGKSAVATFEIPAPESSTRLTIETDLLPDEAISSNNRAPVNIRILESKTRVFLAEGAPYWDSKFLAQLLRQQTQIDLRSVHRLSEERYFRIDTGSEETEETSTAIFPDSLEEISKYDLIVFGKNIDSFLTPARLDILRSYVRDRGGAVLFSRGKPITGSLPGLEALEPVSWAPTTTSDFRFRPSPDGESAGLFGEALPPPDASVWNNLPTLKDARSISLVKPFTRVLANGVPDGSSALSANFPALLVRRYGQGVTGLVNGDGLWKWDFYPEARELGNMYEDFWIQLIQWMASYSEFLPGQDFSLRLPGLRGPSGVAVTASISFRGTSEPPSPTIQLTAPDGSVTELQPAAFPDPSGNPNWRASFTPEIPGIWKLNLSDPRPNAPPTPEATFTVPAPAAESDDLSSDPNFLRSLSQACGGQSINPAGLDALLQSAFKPTEPSATTSGAIWQASWFQWPIAILLVLPLAIEWFLRRRQGLT